MIKTSLTKKIFVKSSLCLIATLFIAPGIASAQSWKFSEQKDTTSGITVDNIVSNDELHAISCTSNIIVIGSKFPKTIAATGDKINLSFTADDQPSVSVKESEISTDGVTLFAINAPELALALRKSQAVTLKAITPKGSFTNTISAKGFMAPYKNSTRCRGIIEAYEKTIITQ